jgi:hypothetical protein
MERELKALINALNDLLAVMGAEQIAAHTPRVAEYGQVEAQILAVMRERAGRWLRPSEIAPLCSSVPSGRPGQTLVGLALKELMRRKLNDGWHVELGQPVGTRTSHYRLIIDAAHVGR